MPSQTPWREAQALLSTFAISLEPSSGTNGLTLYWGVFPVSETSRWQDNLLVSFDVDAEGVIRLIIVDHDYPLSRLTNELNAPAEVWLYPYGIPPVGKPEYELMFFYPSQGIVVEYHGFGSLSSEAEGKFALVICRDDLEKAESGLFLWSPHEKRSFRAVLESRLSGASAFHYQILDESSNMNSATFYKNLVDPTNNKCLQTSLE